MATPSNSNFDPASIGAMPVQASGPTSGDFDPATIGATAVQAPEPAGGFLSNLSTGVAKGEVSTLKALGTAGQFIGNQTGGRVANLLMGKGFTPTEGPLFKGTGAPDFYTPGSADSNAANKFLTPQGAAQNVGYGGEKVAELMTPTGIESGAASLGAHLAPFAPKTASFLARSAGAFVDQGGKTLLGGGDTGQAEGVGALGAISPTLGVLGGLAKSAAGATGEKIINGIIKPLKKSYAYGHDPARGILNESITGSSFEDFTKNIASRLQTIGEQIGQVAQRVTKRGVTSDFSGVVAPLDTAMQTAARNNNPTLLNSLYNVKVALTHSLTMTGGEAEAPGIMATGKKDLSGLNYSQGQSLLDDITAHTRFTGNPSDDKAINQAAQEAYGIARDKLNSMATQVDEATGQEIKDLNQRYGDLSAAKVAANNRDVVLKRNNMVTLAGKIGIYGTGAATLGYALVSGDYATAGKLLLAEGAAGLIGKAAGSVAVQTRIAKFLDALGPADKAGLMNSNPMLRTLYQRFTGDFSGAPKPSPTAPDRTISGLLGPGPEPVNAIPLLGRADTSGMVQSSRIGPSPAFNPRLALPEGKFGTVNGPTQLLGPGYTQEAMVPKPDYSLPKGSGGAPSNAGKASLGAITAGAAASAAGAGAFKVGTTPSTQTVTSSPQPTPTPAKNLMIAIAANETQTVKNPYGFSKPSGSKAMGLDLGKYQVTEGELKSYSKQFLGRAVTSKEFLASPALQDQYMQAKIEFLQSQGLSDEAIMGLHAEGMTHWGNAGEVSQKINQANLTRSNYVNRGDRTLQSLLGTSTKAQ